MNCPYCGARATYNGDAYHCGTRVDGEQSEQCKKDSGDATPFRYMPPGRYMPPVGIPADARTVMTNEREQELREILSAVLKTKGRVPNTLQARIRKFLGDE